MAEAKKFHQKRKLSNEIPEDFKKNPLGTSNDSHSKKVETFDPYAEDAKHSKYWRSLQYFKPLKFSR